MSTSVPRSRLVKTDKGGYQVFIDGRPFLILAGELQNSSFSSAHHMRPLWPRLREDHVNTCLVGVSWSSVEPEEGSFDFKELDEMVKDARSHGLRLILLWFGSFKNGMSTYVPSWIKRNTKRFPKARVKGDNGKTKMTEVLSIFSEENVKTDSRAFGRLMAHIKEVDEEYGTVIMVQVENEVGLLGSPRDIAAPAEKAYGAAVPGELVTMLNDRWDRLHPVLRSGLGDRKPIARTGATWAEVFGTSKHADEVFMAYHYAIYVDTVAKAGKVEYPLPMFTNAWLSGVSKDDVESGKIPTMAGGGENPGDWPSGGPNIGVLDVWMAFAPTLDFFSPDVYLHKYSEILRHWRHNGQPLFIPEQRRDAMGLRWMWEAFGTHGALAASPFGIDTIEEIDRPLVREHFGLLAEVSHYILRSQADPGSCFGFWYDPPRSDETVLSHPKKVRLGKWDLTIMRAFVPGGLDSAYGMIIPLDQDRFLLVGAGYQVHFASTDPNALFTGIIHFDEKRVVDPTTGELETVRRLNGDETMGGKCVVMPSVQPDVSTFPIAIFIKAGTKIAEVEVYDVTEE